jgi:hypothetical protein
LTAECRSPRSVGRANDSVCTNLPLESRAGGGERVHGDILINVYGLRMLAEIVQAGETSRAMALEGPFAGVFPNVSRQMFASRKAQRAWWEIRAEEALSLFLLRGPTVVICALVIRALISVVLHLDVLRVDGMFRMLRRISARIGSHLHLAVGAGVAGSGRKRRIGKR